ncbi:GNAT family N-acetyltransferase [Methanolapillus ohkumae]|uniref:N-acetyltransferase domain-containing protein n=1 Tax=Methanolapillus ohkumae TaxID=3028298 RepID=A0AA96VFV2_9EURY|nr:hypothetical protein MsAm2_15120 [Methanosarcinaceae archaeon Am2]
MKQPVPDGYDKFQIRPATPADVLPIESILSTYFLDRDDISHERFMVAEIGSVSSSKVIGCGVYNVRRMAGNSLSKTDSAFSFCEIHTIAVLPSYKNKGYGKKLLNILMNEISGLDDPDLSKTVYTRTTAPDFFLHMGFSMADPNEKKQLFEECESCEKFDSCAQKLLSKTII